MVTHTETVTVTFDEETIIQHLEELAKNKYYKLTYSGFNIESAVFTVNENGEYCCELKYSKHHETGD